MVEAATIATVVAPAHALGADLLWWRTAGGMRTRATLLWSDTPLFPDEMVLEARLFDGAGELACAWTLPFSPGQPTFIDSADEGPWQAFAGKDGLLAVYACTRAEPGAVARQRYLRLYPLVDWYAPDGAVATLHSDQVVRRGRDKQQQFTEIVVLEDANERNALVVLNGELAQPAGAITLRARSSTGDERVAVHAGAMAPFTVHRLVLAEMFPGLAEFAGGHALALSGDFNSLGLYTRPYIETTGRRWGVYHGGDVYPWRPLPYPMHALVGGEVNPMAVLHDDDTRTWVNLLHSHDGGDEVGEGLGVEASLYDLDGRCVTRRSRWLVARRHGLVRACVADLLPDPSLPFRGHLSLRFEPARGESVPQHLQALVEFRRERSVARSMTWSDEWNSRLRLGRRDRDPSPPRWQAHFRVAPGAGLRTEIAITNAGHEGYDRSAQVEARLMGPTGVIAESRFLLPAFATRMAAVSELFPGQPDHSDLARVVLLTSESDIASMGFTWHEASGALAAEHTVPLFHVSPGRVLIPAGG